MQKMLGYMRKTIQEFDMIQDGDRIAVGVSGGKDSLVDQILQDFHRSVTHGVEPLLCCPMKKGVDCWYTRQSTPDASDEGHSTPNLRCGDPQVMRSNWLPFYRPYSFASQTFICFADFLIIAFKRMKKN